MLRNRKIFTTFVLGLCALLLTSCGSLKIGEKKSPPSQNMAKITPPSGRPFLSLEGEGSQVFRCVIDSKGGYWHFEQAEADLFDKNGELKATQSGPMMAFDHVDGSRVISSHIVAWLNPANPKKDLKLALLKASSDSGNGTLNGVKYIQRLNTQGGIPAGTCSTAGEFLRVPFKADYVFWK